MGLLEQDREGYKLTIYGLATLEKISDSFEFYSAYSKLEDFWKNQDISGIPKDLFARIGALKNATIIENTELNIIKSHEVFLKYLTSITDFFYGVTPIFHREWLKVCKGVIEDRPDTRIIATKEVISEVIKHADEEFMGLCQAGNVQTYMIRREPKVAFTVSDAGLSLSLSTKGSKCRFMEYDLYDDNPSAIKWGIDLFDYYKERAKPVKLADYL